MERGMTGSAARARRASPTDGGAGRPAWRRLRGKEPPRPFPAPIPSPGQIDRATCGSDEELRRRSRDCEGVAL